MVDYINYISYITIYYNYNSITMNLHLHAFRGLLAATSHNQTPSGGGLVRWEAIIPSRLPGSWAGRGGGSDVSQLSDMDGSCTSTCYI